MPLEAATMFAPIIIKDTRILDGVELDRRVVALFPKGNMLTSGMLFGKERIARKAAVVDVKYKK